MPKHIRNRDNRQHRINNCPCSTWDLRCKYENNCLVPHHIRTPKQTLGWIAAIIMIIILLVVVAHYFGYITLPGILGKIPRKAAPASHLQYFFF